MYERHFNLRKDPFSIAPDPHFLYMSERHREALAHLLYGVKGSGGFVLLTGDIGTGKTTVCRCFLEQVPERCKVAIVFNPKLSALELLGVVCQEFGVAVPAAQAGSLKAHVDALNTYLLRSHAAGQSNVLIVDEAQNLHSSVLEQLRLLTNLETHERKLLQIVLIGQPELRDQLKRPELEQLAQRVIARYHLRALNAKEVVQYIEHRLRVAGHSGPLPFDAPALQRIHAISRGIPRRINLLCGRAMLGAWTRGQRQIDIFLVRQAAREVFGDDELRTAKSHKGLVVAVMMGAVSLLCLGAALTLGWQRGMFTGGRPPAGATAPLQVPAAVQTALAGLAAQAAAGDASVPTATAAEPPWPAASTASAPAVAIAAAASAPQALAPQSLTAPPLPLEDLDTLLAAIPGDSLPAWRELVRRWKLPVDSQADPCQGDLLAPWECWRGRDLSLPRLRQLDRPGVLLLQKADEAGHPVLLVGLDEQSALLYWSAALHRVSLLSLARYWHGEFATLWQAPPGYEPGLRPGQASPVHGLLAQQLAQLEGAPAATLAPLALKMDASLVARLKAFQKGQGIKPDGMPGPLTLMQLERVLGQARGPGLMGGAS